MRTVGRRRRPPRPDASPSLYEPAFVAVLAVTLLGFGSFATVQTILPLYAVQLGASATIVGLLVGALSLPSVVLRPFIGQLVDQWSRRGVHLVGTACLSVVAFLYLVPNLAVVLVTRIVHGAGWAAFNTAGGTAVAVMAPPARRGEAAGIYNLMPGIANLAMPAMSLMLVGAHGFGVAFAVAGLMSISATVLLRVAPSPAEQGWTHRVRPRRAALLEPHALLPMALEFLFTLTTTLFWVYPPLFGQALGIPLEDMAGYYVPVGITVVVARIVVGRRIDRVARRVMLLLGCGATALALVVAGSASSIAILALAGALHAVAASMITPSAMAMAIDGSSDDRRGAAIATYSLGFQLGVGTGAIAWGAVIDLLGFPAPYLVALFSPLALATLVVRSRRLAVAG